MNKNRVTATNAMPYRDNPNPDRRDFLTLITQGLLYTSGLLGLGWLVRFWSYEDPHTSETRFDLGEAATYPAGSLTPIPEAQAILLHSPDGFQAFSLVCPHLGCVVNLTETGYECPCHGSRFDSLGQVVNGPATASMRSLKVEVLQDGTLILLTR